MIPDAVQVSGSDSDEAKESKFLGFINGTYRVLVTKPRIGAWGLNFQHCRHVTYFPSHSYEQYYQAIRRCWRFGQEREVKVDVVLSEGEQRIFDNLSRKAEQAETMFDNLVEQMNDAISIGHRERGTMELEKPSWL